MPQVHKADAVRRGIAVSFALTALIGGTLWGAVKEAGDFGAVAVGHLPGAAEPGKARPRGPGRVAPDWVLCDLQRATNGQWQVVPWPGSASASDRATNRASEARPVTLAEALTQVKAKKWPRLMLPVRPETMGEAVAAIRQAGVGGRVGWFSADAKELAQAHQLVPEVPTFYRATQARLDEVLAAAGAGRFNSAILDPDQLTPEALAKLHQGRLAAGAWQPEGDAEMKRLIDLDVDYICTPDFEELIALQVQLGVRPSRGGPIPPSRPAGDENAPAGQAHGGGRRGR